MKKKIWLSAPFWSGREEKYIRAAVSDNWIAPGGPNVAEFEKRIAEQTGRKFCKAVNSGTSALHLSLLALGTGPGDTVFCPDFTFAAVINPIIYAGATPVLIDCDPVTWNMHHGHLMEALQEHSGENESSQPGKCLIALHNYGMPADMENLVNIAETYSLKVIEEASEALGSTCRGVPAGQSGHVSTLSFNGNKIVTASTGGALVSDNRQLIDRAAYLSAQAKEPDRPFYHSEEVGYNYQLSNINAGIGIGQLETLPWRVGKKRHINDYYRHNLGDIPGITFQEEPEGMVSNRWLTCIQVDPEKTGGTGRDRIYRELMEENIESRFVWKPLHLQPAYSQYRYFGSGVGDKLFERGLCLPSGAGLTDEDLERVVDVVRKCFRGN